MAQIVANKSSRGVWAFIIVLLILFSFYPYEFTSVYFRFVPRGPGFTVIMALFAMALYSFSGRKVNIPTGFVVVAIIQFIGLFVHSMHIGQNIVGQFSTIFTILLPFYLLLFVEATMGLEVFYRRYNKWILFMAILGTIAWILVSFFGMPPFSSVISRSDERTINNYILTFNILNEFGGDTMRYSGFFDEPGAMAYWGLFALIINKLYIKNNKLELILAISLLFTFSFGYYVQLFLFLLLFNLNYKNLGKSILYIGLIVLLLFGASRTEHSSFSFIYDQTIGRVTEAFIQSQVSDNALNIDSRAGLTEAGLEEFQANPILGTTKQDIRVGNNIYEPLALYGLVGAPLVLSPFLYWLFLAIKRRDKDFLKAFIVIVVGFTHRPFHVGLLYFFVVYSIIFMYLKFGVKNSKV